ncbi:MAG: ATP12 family chaperone protein [Dongiaceae bacterium]
MKRAYQKATVAPVGGQWHVLLDDKPLRSPARRLIELPNVQLAETIAAEWSAQGDSIDLKTMPVMRLAATAIDWVASNRDRVIELTASYAETDLLCYRAERPVELVARQQAIWQPLIDWASLRFDAPLIVTSGVMPRRQPPQVAAVVRSAVAAYETLPLMAVHSITVSCGSVILGLALTSGHVDAEAVWQASQLDESFQIERWGEDAEASRRRAALRADIEASARLVRLLRAVS